MRWDFLRSVVASRSTKVLLLPQVAHLEQGLLGPASFGPLSFSDSLSFSLSVSLCLSLSLSVSLSLSLSL